MEFPLLRLSCNLTRADGWLDLAMEDKGTPHAVGGSSSPVRARTAAWVPHDTWRWVLLCFGDGTVWKFVVVAAAVARCKSKGQCYLLREYLRRWTEHKMWGERPWRGGVWGKSKLATMVHSGSLAPHFVNNDYVTADIVIAVHMCIVRYSLGHGVCEVHVYVSSCVMAMSIGLAWEERMQHGCCCVSQERGCVHVCCVMSVATAAVPARRKQICLQFLWLLVSAGLSACVNSKTVSAVNRMKRNTALFLPFSVLGVHGPQLSDLQSAFLKSALTNHSNPGTINKLSDFL